MDTSEIITAVIAAITGGGLTQIANWRINQKKGKAEVKRDEIENIRQTMETVYQPIIERQNVRIAELEAEVTKLRREKREQEDVYQKQIRDLQKQIIEINRALGIGAQKAIRNSKGQFVSRKSEEDEQ